MPQLQHYAIDLERSRGQLAEAIQRQQSLQGVTGESPDWHIRMAELLVSIGRHKQAVNHFDQADSKLVKRKNTAARTALAERITQLRQALTTL